jgi:HEPN domain-containing protein
MVQFLHGSARGRSVTAIVQQLPKSVEVPESILRAARELDKVYVTSRYPNGFAAGSPSDYFTQETSQQLIHYAREVIQFCTARAFT